MNLLSSAKDTGDVLASWARYKGGDKDALADIVQAANEGNNRAQNLVGYLYDNGEGLPRDSHKAAEYFRRAADTFPLARYNLGVLTFYGRGVAKDERAAIDLFKDSAIKSGVAQASVQIAIYALKTKDVETAYRWSNEGAVRGSVKAFYLLGRIHYDRRNYKEAWLWLQKAAAAVEPNSPAIISLMYRDGLGIGQNQTMAAAWWLIYLGLNKHIGGRGTPSIASFRLAPDQQARAINFSQTWLDTHRESKKIDYQRTLLDPG